MFRKQFYGWFWSKNRDFPVSQNDLFLTQKSWKSDFLTDFLKKFPLHVEEWNFAVTGSSPDPKLLDRKLVFGPGQNDNFSIFLKFHVNTPLPALKKTGPKIEQKSIWQYFLERPKKDL